MPRCDWHDNQACQADSWLDDINNKNCFIFYYVIIAGGEAPMYKYMVKYKALLVFDVDKLTVSLTGLIIMLTTPWHLA